MSDLDFTFDALLERVSAGERLSADDIHDLAATPDILSLGMLADALRRRLHDTRTTFLRVAECAFEAQSLEPAQVKAQEIRITGSPAHLADAMRAVEVIKSKGDRTVSAFSWSDVERMAAGASIAAGTEAAARRGSRQRVGSAARRPGRPGADRERAGNGAGSRSCD